MLEEQGCDQLLAAVRREAGEADFDLAVVLGSGLGALTAEVAAAAVFPYGDFTCFHGSTVPGHAGVLYAGNLFGCRALLFSGRQHLYEGYTAFRTTLPVRLAHALGCRRLLLTNAAGGIRDDFAPGEFMLVSDHLNLLGDNPLRGLSAPFVDLSHLYRYDFHAPLQSRLAREGIALHCGVLAALPGPSYETPAEIRMLRQLGADAVSMSTVPEAIVGKYLGMQVVAVSLIANKAAGLAGSLSHGEVLASARQASPRFVRLAADLLTAWQGLSPE